MGESSRGRIRENDNAELIDKREAPTNRPEIVPLGKHDVCDGEGRWLQAFLREK